MATARTRDEEKAPPPVWIAADRLWMRRPAWESVLEEMGDPIVRAGAGRPTGWRPESPAPFRPLSRGGRTLPAAPLPGGASRRVGQPASQPASQPAHEGLSPKPDKRVQFRPRSTARGPPSEAGKGDGESREAVAAGRSPRPFSSNPGGGVSTSRAAGAPRGVYGRATSAFDGVPAGPDFPTAFRVRCGLAGRRSAPAPGRVGVSA